ncbi:MAG: hypothetical protein ACHQQ3_13870 [Gemmatimonadales bacterium]
MSRSDDHKALRTRRRALQRSAGLLALLVFGMQATAGAWSRCDITGSRDAASMMPGMAHHAPAHDGTPQSHVPPPANGSGCDHQQAASLCALGAGCAVASPAAIVASAAPAVPEQGPVAAPVGTPDSRNVAPDDPPPRA